MDEINKKIEELLSISPYNLSPKEKKDRIFPLIQKQIKLAANLSPEYNNYITHWPIHTDRANDLQDLPFLPVSAFKRDPILSLVEPEKIVRTLYSSGTSQQIPSQIPLDSITARNMSKGVVAILKDFIGYDRRPYLVVDEPPDTMPGASLGARGAAIRGLFPFSKETAYCINPNNNEVDMDVLLNFLNMHKNENILIYGFTAILWSSFVIPLIKKDICLNLSNVFVLHSGGWKKLTNQKVSKNHFNEKLSRVVGCPRNRIIDFYGMVENLGIIYPDCSESNKHAPAFGEVIIRDPLTLLPVNPSETGIVQVCSALPTSFPGHLLLTEDLATVVAYDDCPCGRRGISFRFFGRIPKSENRGCGNIN